MSHITTINFEGTNVTIDQELFQNYMKESFEHLGAMEEADQMFKEVVETVAENTGLKKAKISKYLKERFAAKTKATKELGVLFEKLDEVVES
jgi:transcription termination factor NusB